MIEWNGVEVMLEAQGGEAWRGILCRTSLALCIHVGTWRTLPVSSEENGIVSCQYGILACRYTKNIKRKNEKKKKEKKRQS